MTKTLIIPGLDGSPQPHWQHWWALHEPGALLVEQDNWTQPTPEAWETQLAGAIITHPDSVLVAHSLGCILVARLLARWPQLRVKAALLVAPADTTRDDRLHPFVPTVRARLPVPVTVVGSRNDPWMSFGQSAELAAHWGAELIDLGFAGHINVASGFGPWPGGIALRNDLLRRAALPAPATGLAGRSALRIGGVVR